MLADGGSATGGPEKAGNHFHRGRLSGPVGAEKSQHFARLNGKADRIDNEMIGVTLAQRTGLNHWHASLMHAAQHRKNAPRRCQIGRASCRERVCQYVEISVVAASKKKNK